jgi:hypothetical protein
VIRGYNTTPGDLDNQNRGSDGLLDTTNYPDITITGIVVPVNFWILQNLDITGALSSTLIGGATHDRWSMVNCRVVNTQNNASAQAVRGDDFVVFVNCDFACTGAAHFAVVQCDFNAKILGCTFSGVQTNQYLLYIATTSTIADCVFFGPGGTSFGLYFGQLYTSEPSCVANCTFYNLGTAIQTGNNAPASGLFVYNCHVTDCSKFIDNLNAATNQITVIEVNNRLRDVTTPRT